MATLYYLVTGLQQDSTKYLEQRRAKHEIRSGGK